MKKLFTLLIGYFCILGCDPSNTGNKEKGKEKKLQQLERYIKDWKEREALPPEHHFLFLGIGNSCPGCSHLFIQKARETDLEEENLSVVILLRQRRRPNALSWVEKTDNARIDTNLNWVGGQNELPFPLYLGTDNNGKIIDIKGLKRERKSVRKTLGW